MLKNRLMKTNNRAIDIKDNTLPPMTSDSNGEVAPRPRLKYMILVNNLVIYLFAIQSRINVSLIFKSEKPY